MSEITMACACGHVESDHSTQSQIELGYPTGCTAVVVDSPDPRFLELCGCAVGPAPLPRAEATG